jgi:hypothetical protein
VGKMDEKKDIILCGMRKETRNRKRYIGGSKLSIYMAMKQMRGIRSVEKLFLW